LRLLVKLNYCLHFGPFDTTFDQLLSVKTPATPGIGSGSPD